MKKIMLCLFGCVLTLQCFANCVQEIDDKVYVSSDSIYFLSDKIYIGIDSNLIPVEGIAVDENGIYIISTARAGYCSKCGNSYSGYLRDHMRVCPAIKY